MYDRTLYFHYLNVCPYMIMTGYEIIIYNNFVVCSNGGMKIHYQWNVRSVVVKINRDIVCLFTCYK